MKFKSFLVPLAIVIAGLLIAAAIYYSPQAEKKEPLSPPQQSPPLSPLPTPTPSEASLPTVIPSPSAENEESTFPPGWRRYRNEDYGFQISYPESYQVLDDKENLYGWPQGIVLFYQGGQSYDLAIEAWNTTAEYEQKYQGQMDNLTIKKVGAKYITLLNTNNSPEVAQIIATFELTN